MRASAILATAALALAGIAGCGDEAGDGGSNEGGGDGTPTRIAVEDMTDEQREDFVDALLRLKEMPSPFPGYERFSYYDGFIKWHKDAFDCDQQTAHSGPNFFPWHRYLLHLFEEALTEAAGKPIAIPYWDFTSAEATNAVFRDDFMGGDGNIYARNAVTSGPFRKGEWRLNVIDQRANYPIVQRHLVRRIGSFKGIATLPTAASVQRALAVPLYDTVPYDDRADPADSFRNSVEGWRQTINEQCVDGIFLPLTRFSNPRMAIHNRIHMYVGGIDGKQQGTLDMNTSPNDPIFWLIHANVDRLWESWMAIHGNSYAPTGGWPREGENLDDAMIPWKDFGDRVTPEMMLDGEEWGSSYDQLVELDPDVAERVESRLAGAGPSAAPPPSLAAAGFSCALR